MAMAKKCDRCGKYYDYKTPSLEERSKEENHRKIIDSFDFCEGCIEEFKWFMKEGASNDNSKDG